MISAIILTYNEELIIHSIIKDLKNQDFQGTYELILADGGSIDKTVSIGENENVKIVACRKGKSCQMNEAAKVAKEKFYFLFMQICNYLPIYFQLLKVKSKKVLMEADSLTFLMDIMKK